jgi:lipopolysaccharide transport system ATP-binding protein
MSDSIISVENLSKRYLLGRQRMKGDGLRHSLENALRAPLRWFRSNGNLPPSPQEFWALRDVSFQVRQGEVMGIIGRNGAGKSTLLKILSRITEPTDGRIRLKGRVASLLEVGTGFHQELTGRENIFLNGAILGMSKAEISRKFDEIVAFSEIEKFLDTPVKRYSSGMYVRLAFAVAAHLEPDVLIVDEVLAVGDSAFQKKCLGKMSEVAHGGRTVLFVSHNMGIVSALCKQIVLLERGRVGRIGDPQTVIPLYLRNDGANGARVENIRAENGRVTLIRAETRDAEGSPRSQFHTGESVNVVIDFEIHGGSSSVINPVIEVCDEFDNSVFSTTNFNEREWYTRNTAPGRYQAVCRLPRDIFNDRSYTVCVLFVEHLREALIRVPAQRLDFVDSGQFRDIYNGPIGGYLRPLCDWQTRPVA